MSTDHEMKTTCMDDKLPHTYHKCNCMAVLCKWLWITAKEHVWLDFGKYSTITKIDLTKN